MIQNSLFKNIFSNYLFIVITSILNLHGMEQAPNSFQRKHTPCSVQNNAEAHSLCATHPQSLKEVLKEKYIQRKLCSFKKYLTQIESHTEKNCEEAKAALNETFTPHEAFLLGLFYTSRYTEGYCKISISDYVDRLNYYTFLSTNEIQLALIYINKFILALNKLIYDSLLYDKIIHSQKKENFTLEPIDNKKCDFFSEMEQYRNSLYDFAGKNYDEKELKVLRDFARKRALLVINQYTIHRIFFTALVLAVKYLNDNVTWNSYYTYVGEIDNDEFLKLELTFLYVIDCDLYVYQKGFDYASNTLHE